MFGVVVGELLINSGGTYYGCGGQDSIRCHTKQVGYEPFSYRKLLDFPIQQTILTAICYLQFVMKKIARTIVLGAHNIE